MHLQRNLHLLVRNSMKPIAQHILWYRVDQYLARYRPYTIAVAGTYGRSTAAASILQAIHAHRHVRLAAAGSQPRHIPEGILGVSERAGMSFLDLLAAGKMKELTEYEPDTIIAQVPLLAPGLARQAISHIVPRMLVLTHSGYEHLDLFGSQDMVMHEYQILTQQLASDAVIVLNVDDVHFRDMLGSLHHNVITYGTHEKADIRARRATRSESGSGIFLELSIDNVAHELYLPYSLAKQHMYGALAGIAVAHAMGVSSKDAIAGVQQVKPPHGIFSRVHGKNDSVVIDDTNNTTFDGILSSLTSLTSMLGAVRKIVVLKDIEGLGARSRELHERIGTAAASAGHILVFVGELMLAAQAAAGRANGEVDTHHFDTVAEVEQWLPAHIKKGDVVYVGGGLQELSGSLRK